MNFAIAMSGILFCFVIFAFLFKNKFRRYSKNIYIFTLLSIAIFVIGNYVDISFANSYTDVVFVFIVLTLIVLSIILMTTENRFVVKIIAWFLLVAIIVPLLLSMPIMIVFSTDIFPVYSIKLKDNSICKVYSYGDATTDDGGYFVTKNKHYFIFENEVDEIKYSTYKGGGTLNEKNVCSLFYQRGLKNEK